MTTTPDATTPVEPSQRLAYEPGLDGLRGVAVAGVVVFHYADQWMPSGFLGVDAFFVLSGFLITRLLLTGVTGGGRTSLRSFWAARARRLLPALVLFAAAVVVYMWWLADATQLGQLRRELLATLGYSANWEQVVSGVGYFDQFSDPSPLRHTWSLAIEEQFYLVWPLVVAAVVWWTARRGRSRFTVADRLLALSAHGAVASALIAAILWQTGTSHGRVYFGTDTRVQAILIGCALGASWSRLRRTSPLLPVLGVVAAALVLWSWTIEIAPDPLFFYGLLLHAGAVGLVIVAATVPGPVRVALSVRPLRLLGRISYGVYLWHVLVAVVLNEARTGLDGASLFGVRVAVTLAIATVSYHAVELPVRRGRVQARPLGFGFAVASVVVTLAIVWSTTNARPSLAERYEEAAPSEEAPPQIPATEPIDVLVLGDEAAAALESGPEPEDATEVRLTVLPRSVCPLDEGPSEAIARPGQTKRCGEWLQLLSERLEGVPRPDLVVLAVGTAPGLADRPEDPFSVLLSEDTRTVADQLQEVLAAFDRSTPAILLVPDDADRPPTSAERRFRQVADQLAAAAPGRRVVEPIDAVDRAELGQLARDLVLDAAVGEARTVTKVMLLGDSVAWSLGHGWYGDPDTGAGPGPTSPVSLWNRGVMFCELTDLPQRRGSEQRPASPACADWRTDWPARLDEFQPDVTLLVHGAWELFDRQVDGEWIETGTEAHNAIVREALNGVIDRMATPERPLALVTLPPGGRAAEDSPLEWTPAGNAAVYNYNDILAELTAENPDRVVLIDLAEWLCPGGECQDTRNGQVIREDGIHFDPAGARIAADWITAELDRLGLMAGAT